MAPFITSCTGQLRSAGFTGIVSTVETVGTYQQYPALCAAVETTVHANIHPYFDPNTSSSNAGTFVVNQRGLVSAACGGKTVIISETGWPSAGGSNGAAIASSSDQAAAIASIKAATNNDGVTWFSYTNDPWKPAGVEQNFGMNTRKII